MMMNRDRIGFWVKFVAFGLAFVFLASSIVFGLGMTGAGYNLFELVGGSGQQQQASQSPSPQDGIEEAERELRQNPNDPDAIKDLASLYFNAGRYDDAARVLKDGREAAPKDEEIPLLLGQVYYQKAQGVSKDEQKELQGRAGDAFAAATEIEPDNEDAYLLAGQAYEQAGQPAEAIKYYNGYLDREPEGEQAQEVEARISALLEGGESTSGG